MGGVVTIGRLIIDSDDMSEGNSESAGGLEALDDSPGPEVLALLAGGCRIKLSGCEVVTPGVVGGRHVSYLRWEAGEEGLVASPPSKCGILEASAAWEEESLGTWAEEALCLLVHLYERAHRVRAMSKMKDEPRVHALKGRGIDFSKWDARGARNRMEGGWDHKVVEKNEGFARCLVFAKWGTEEMGWAGGSSFS